MPSVESLKERGMRPDEGDLDEELRGHLAINIKERIDRGESPGPRP